MSSSINELAESALNAANRPIRSTSSLVSGWEEFVDECESGYDWTIYEYNDEIAVRDDLQIVLDATASATVVGADQLKDVVREIDERFRNLIIPNVSAKTHPPAMWWRNGILSYAGEAYVESIFATHKIEVPRTSERLLSLATKPGAPSRAVKKES